MTLLGADWITAHDDMAAGQAGMAGMHVNRGGGRERGDEKDLAGSNRLSCTLPDIAGD